MRLLYSFRFQQIGDTWLASAVGQNAHLFNGVLQLNEVGHFIVSELAKLSVSSQSSDGAESSGSSDLSEQQLIEYMTNRLTKEYAVDCSTAQSAVQQVLDYLKTEGVISD